MVSAKVFRKKRGKGKGEREGGTKPLALRNIYHISSHSIYSCGKMWDPRGKKEKKKKERTVGVVHPMLTNNS